jgi:hypothetical protein
MDSGARQLFFSPKDEHTVVFIFLRFLVLFFWNSCLFFQLFPYFPIFGLLPNERLRISHLCLLYQAVRHVQRAALHQAKHIDFVGNCSRASIGQTCLRRSSTRFHTP